MNRTANNRIIVRGASQNNLNNLDVDLQCNRITVITGVSGSGKSSLAFDTLYAEGQRRYIESFSAYARQFMDRMDKPNIRSIEGILPAIAISQTNPIKSSRSTLGTFTEINDYMKLLFSRMARLFCRQCGRLVEKDSSDTIAKKLLQRFESVTSVITFPFFVTASSLVSPEEIEKGLRRQGFFRIYHHGKVKEISTGLISDHLDACIDIVSDRIVISGRNKKRLTDSIETAVKFGKGLLTFFFPEDMTPPLKLSTLLHCPNCNISYRKPSPNLFSFNSPLGACKNCNGFGKTIEVDIDAVIPDKTLSVKDNAIKPWSTPSYREAYYDLLSYCKKKKIPTDKPFKSLQEKYKDAIVYGNDDFYGVTGFFNWLETKTYKMHIRVLLSKYRAYRTCSECNGTRFKDDTLLFRIDGKSIADIYSMNINESFRFFEKLKNSTRLEKTADVLLNDIISRLEYLDKIGLGYLTLYRQSRTLSGGEIERASLTTALGSSLVNTLYVLDEPSIGLHPRDTSRLINILRGLRDTGNTIVMVEHDPDIIMQSDTVIDLGPFSGERGGNIVFHGTPLDLVKSRSSLTGQYLSGSLNIPVPEQRRKPDQKNWIKIVGASIHNLKNISLDIPLGIFVCITGVSGSGKSTLLEEVIHKNLAKKGEKSNQCFIDGDNSPDNVILMDQSPIGKSPRSNPITYMKVFDAIRNIFARTELAKGRHYTASTFSFNTSGGRCEQCQGEGFEKIEMQFLADVYVSCLSCRSTRYTSEVLDVTYQDRNIHDVLQMTVSEARDFFSKEPKIEYPLRLLEMVGLGYLRLGQPANTLSGGESQRLKLASFIRQGSTGRTLFLFDEPTTGLHQDDIKKLLKTFNFFLNHGHSIIIVEHNMEIIKCADHIIDLGPEGGDDGGYVLVQGTPEETVQKTNSHTGAFLGKYLDPKKRHLPEEQGLNTDVLSRKGSELCKSNVLSCNNHIEIEGAREHNLDNISLKIPRQKMVVITGLSGSGKSTLAFDIIFAEGERRFLETLSPFARQYITRLNRPEVDSVRGLPPSVAIEQLLSRGGRKSTVATTTEIYHYLRLLFAKTGKQHCTSCGQTLTLHSSKNIAEDILKAHAHNPVMILSPLVRGRKGFHKDIIRKAKKDGYEKIRIDGKIIYLKNIFAVKRYHEHQIELVTSEMTPCNAGLPHLHSEVKKALALGEGEMILVCSDGTEEFYSMKSHCSRCKISMEELDPRLFSFNSRHGACHTCSGYGTFTSISPDFLVCDRKKTIGQGAIAPLSATLISKGVKKKIFIRMQNDLKISMEVPVEKISQKKYKALFYGNKSFPGLVRLFEDPAMQKKPGWNEYMTQFYSEMPCPDCKGTRLNAAARCVTINGKSIADLTSLTPGRLFSFLSSLSLTERQKQIARPVFQELLPKLSLLEKAGLSYLTLNRSADSLSGGEAQRIRLVSQVASNLKGVAYVLDEPTIGLHPHDNENLLKIIRELQQKGNSVIVVEHDEDTIRSADYIVDLGPGGGTCGGKIVASGTLQDLIQNRSSVTGSYLSGRNRNNTPVISRPVNGCSFVTIFGAREHNLKEITVMFPVGRLIVVTGVSGSGKTTLVRETLFRGLKKIITPYYGRVGAHEKIIGADQFKRVVEIDQSPIVKTPRSIPATYVGFYNEIRTLFSLLPDARIRGYSPGRFSFNVRGGRCEKCSGQGKTKIVMSFLPDMYVDCEVCQGRRFNEETLQILFKGKDISQVLSMTVEEGCDFFKGLPAIYKPLSILNKMGLGYVSLGQPSPTLSGGEAQRIKIASELCKSDHGKTLYIFDEPTTGLHFADIEKLMEILQSLIDLGNTIVIIEHNLEVIRQADYIIDLGPGGGEKGGAIVAVGPPEEVAASQGKKSLTAKHLRKYLKRHCGL